MEVPLSEKPGVHSIWRSNIWIISEESLANDELGYGYNSRLGWLNVVCDKDF